MEMHPLVPMYNVISPISARDISITVVLIAPWMSSTRGVWLPKRPAKIFQITSSQRLTETITIDTTDRMGDFMHIIRPGVAAPAASSNTSSCNVKIHTAAFLQVLEMVSKQVVSSNKRIIGTLLGYRSEDGSEFEVRDAFVVPCNETGDSIAIEEHHHKTMFQLYKRAHPKESVLGWFGTSGQIDNTTGLIHDFYSKGSDRAFPYPAIYLNVNFKNDQDEIIPPQITSYIGASIGKNSTGAAKMNWKTNLQHQVSNSYVFMPIPNQVIPGTTTEKLALNSLLDNRLLNQPNIVNSDSSESNLAIQISAIITNINKLLSHLETFNPNDDNDLELLRALSNNLSTKPQSLFDLQELKLHFAAYNQDVIMIEYLTKVVKEQIELSARLTANSESDKKDRE